jgi:hypothetical protein
MADRFHIRIFFSAKSSATVPWRGVIEITQCPNRASANFTAGIIFERINHLLQNIFG